MATSQSPKIFLNHLPPVLPSMPPSEIPNMPNITIDCNGVVKLLGQLNPSKANGPDQIPTRVLKEAAPAIAPYLYYIFQQSLDSGNVPADHDWRHANIFAIYKKGSRVGAANYRPISLTSVPCKIMEHIICHNIMIHLNRHDILVHFCETQLINTVEHLARSIDNRCQTDLLILDFSKAFDKVAHNRLLLKMNYYGIRGPTLTWMRS